MRKIVFIAANENAPWGGSEYLWSRAAEKLAQRGVEVCVSVLDWDAPVAQVEHLRSLGCRIFPRPRPSLLSRGLRNLFPGRDYARHVSKLAAGADLAVVSQGDYVQGLPWMEALRSNGYRYAPIVQGSAETKWPDDALIDRLVPAYEGACASYFVSQATLALVRRMLVAPLSNGRVIRNPFNVSYNARPPWPSHAAAQLSLAFVARLEIMGKGHDLLIQVLSLPHWRERDIRVSLFGDGPNERALRRWVENAKLTSVQFGGFVGDVEKLWAAHHALILPSRYEGMPLVLVEAMLCGRPSIITDVGGVRELVRDGVNGFLAKAPTVELLDEAMNRAWENRHRLKEMGEQAAIDVRKFVGPDPVEDFVRDLLSLVEAPVPASKPAPESPVSGRRA
ncbi:MAG: glycosyltransferase family 4 protein [Candidatus Acidiferrales bacterium]